MEEIINTQEVVTSGGQQDFKRSQHLEEVPKKVRKQTLPKSIKEEEFFKLLRCVREKDRQAKVAFLLAFGSGLRLSEVRNVTKDDIRDNSILVRQGKYSKDRIVPRPKGWKEWMSELLPIKKSGRSLERNFKLASKKAGLNPLYTFHSLRHGFATKSLADGIPINMVQFALGHSNVSTTNVYIRADPQDVLKKYQELF